MELRPYRPADFDTVRTWVADERSHMLWCARRFPYPLTREGFEEQLTALSRDSGDRFFTAVQEDGAPVGFFGLTVRGETRTGWLKFVIVAPACRGRGIGREMVGLAVRTALETPGVDSVRLSVFAENPAALRCYEAAGFAAEDRDDPGFRYGDECWARRFMRYAPEAGASGAGNANTRSDEP